MKSWSAIDGVIVLLTVTLCLTCLILAFAAALR